MAVDIVGNNGLFEPIEAVGLQGLRGADGLGHTPAHIGVDHQGKIGAQLVAHHRHPLDVFGEAIAAGFHFDGVKTLL